MSQPTNFNIPQSGDPAPDRVPSVVASRMQGSLQALLSSHSGAAVPAYAVLGTIWCNSTTKQLYMNDGTDDLPIVVLNDAVPSSATDTGTPGQWAADADYIYVCTATNTWKRVAIATW